MTFAVVDIAGFQESVSPGMRLKVPTLKGKKDGDMVTFDRVFLLGKGEGKVSVGAPHVEGASVEATVLRSGRGEKIHVFKMKHRKRYRRTQGHRQGFMEIEVVKIEG